jgi:sulfur carrier protein ThiS
MGAASTAKRCVQVTLLRPGVGQQDFKLPEGATLADLLREAGQDGFDSNVLIDDQPVEEHVTLKSGTIITLPFKSTRSTVKRSWKDSVGTVQDTSAYREMIAAGRAIRGTEQEAIGDRIDQDAE